MDARDGDFILSGIKTPADLADLNYAELEQLAVELRAVILATMSQTGGHLASSLGAVEIILAMHRAFPSEDDSIVFDVGHQSIAHKLLTGRMDKISTLRQYGGISGFPRRSESKYDVHDSGHASDSLSIAIGLLLAKQMNGQSGDVSVLIGDASITGGMAFEALNHIGQTHRNLIIVLNDNGMSIARNVGAISLFLGKIRLSQEYTHLRSTVEENVGNLGRLGHLAVKFGEELKNSVKKFLVGGTFFEDLGITYLGPIDGHSIPDMEEALKAAKDYDGPVLIHAVTRKGKGYGPAEYNPSKFHGIPGFDIDTGETVSFFGSSGYTKVFSRLMEIEGGRNEKLVAITAAMSDGTGLSAFERAYPDRFFDVGISEEHAVSLAAGLAIGGRLPVVAIYSTFLQRAYDQMMIDVALQGLHVVFCIDRAGLVGRDGSTHHGLFDLAYLRSMPGMTILAPSSTAELAGAFATAIKELDGPVAIRYPRSSEEIYEPTGNEAVWEKSRALCLRNGDDVAILAVGRMVSVALKAADILATRGIECSVYDMRWVKPMDLQTVQAARRTRLIATIEDGTIVGGFADAVLEELSRRLDLETDDEFSVVNVLNANGEEIQVELAALGHPPVIRFGIDDSFVQQGCEAELMEELGLNPEQVADKIERNLL